MLKLEDVEFPNRYLECYESVLLIILMYEGLDDEASVLGTQTYFVIKQGGLAVFPRFNHVNEEWERVYGLVVEALPAVDEGDLRDKIVARLDAGFPVCLPVDIYLLAHTPHYNHLHQHHYVSLFGYDDTRYYMVCPYYRFRGWVDIDLIHRGFFAPVVEKWRQISFVPELALEPLSPERVRTLAQESCLYMLGRAVPEVLAGVDSQYLGLAGVRTCAGFARRLLDGRNTVSRDALLLLSSQFKEIGYSRYWFRKLIQNSLQTLLPPGTTDDLWGQFEGVVKSWISVGTMLGAGVHGGNTRLIQRAVLGLEQVHEQERRLFLGLLGYLSGYEQGKL